MDSIFITELTIRNFKAFRKLHTTDFAHVNLITGANNVGKTSLLEAIFLCLGPSNPSLPLVVNARRGLTRVSPKQSTIPYLFNKGKTTEPVSFEVKTLEGLKYNLKIELVEPVSYEVSPSPSDTEELFGSQAMTIEDMEPTITVRLTYVLDGSPPQYTEAIIQPRKINVRGEKALVVPDSVFVSSAGPFDLQEQAKRYSALDREGGIPILEQLLRTIDPELKRTSLAIENEMTMIHGDTGFGLVPLTLLGSGSTRLMNILLAIAYSNDAVVLIDEIENSFHHSALDSVWSSIARFSSEYRCQVFAATHSQECVSSALKAFKHEGTPDFRVHRLDRRADKCELFTFDRDDLKAALDAGWEVR